MSGAAAGPSPERQVLSDEGIILAVHSAQQLAVLDPGPSATGNGVYGMTRKFRSKAYG